MTIVLQSIHKVDTAFLRSKCFLKLPKYLPLRPAFLISHRATSAVRASALGFSRSQSLRRAASRFRVGKKKGSAAESATSSVPTHFSQPIHFFAQAEGFLIHNKMAKDKSEKKDKREKKEKKEKLAEKNGVSKSSKKEKKEKRLVVPEERAEAILQNIENRNENAAIKPQLADESSGDVKVDAEVGAGEEAEKMVLDIKPKGALVPFANPLADEKVAKKVFKGVKKGGFCCSFPAEGATTRANVPMWFSSGQS